MPRSPPVNGAFAQRSHRCHTTDIPQGVNHRFLFLKRSVASRFHLAQVDLSQQRPVRLETERGVQNTHHCAHRDEGRRYQQRADCNLCA